VELRIFEKFPDPFLANLFADAGVKDLNCAIADHAANDSDAIPISRRFIPDPAQKLRAFRRQGKRDRNHRVT
jgi:hypothetical protein